MQCNIDIDNWQGSMTIMANAMEVITTVKFQARLEISQVAGGHSCHRIVWTSLSRCNQYTAMYHQYQSISISWYEYHGTTMYHQYQYQYHGMNISVLPSQVPRPMIYGLHSRN